MSSAASCDDSPTCDPSVSNCADFCENDLLPAGIWQVDIEGVDLFNLNAWRSDNLFGFCLNCDRLPRPYLVGDTVFEDLNGNGEQDPGEPGIPGVLVELLRDTVTAPAPVTPAQAAGMLARLRHAAILDGVRDMAPVDRVALAETVARISELVADHADRIAEIDVNPLICRGGEALAVDALIVRRP